jgi:hypothetical protein
LGSSFRTRGELTQAPVYIRGLPDCFFSTERRGMNWDENVIESYPTEQKNIWRLYPDTPHIWV